MRALLVLLHRWFGLAVAVFLFIAGATGALISWDHELDAWLNPQLFHARSADQPGAGAPLPGLELARRVEQAEPRLRVTYVLTEAEPGHTMNMMVEPRLDPATGKPFALDYNQIAVDPVTAEIQGRRMWGAISLSRENLLPFLYKLHYSLHLPAAGGVELGLWLMGLIAIAWVLDCFIALWISFPRRTAWRRSFAFRWREGGHRLVFDLHRSGGVWLWALVLVVAVTSVSMNLQREIVGDLLDTTDPQQVRVAGGMLARLQDALAGYPRADRLPPIAVSSKPLGARITGWLDSSAAHLPTAARDTLRGWLAGAPSDGTARQLVHFDFRSANVLWANGEIAAIIDFEEAQPEYRLVELARAAVLLGTRYHDWAPTPADVRAAFLAGYESVRSLTPAESAWWDIVLLWQALAMVPSGDDPTGWGAAASALCH